MQYIEIVLKDQVRAQQYTYADICTNTVLVDECVRENHGTLIHETSVSRDGCADDVCDMTPKCEMDRVLRDLKEHSRQMSLCLSQLRMSYSSHCEKKRGI